MADNWSEFLDSIGSDAAKLLKGELGTLLSSSLVDSDAFVQKQAGKLERYLNQLAIGEIDPEQFTSLMKDLEELTRMQSEKMKVAAKASAQRLADGINTLVLDKLLGLLP